MAEADSSKTILAADIGGTSSRFALFHAGRSLADSPAGLQLVRKLKFPTNSCMDSAHLMRILAESTGNDGGYFAPASPKPVQIDAAVFAIPGPASVADISITPPEGEICNCPNVKWPLEASPIIEALQGAPIRFINDFAANGLACAMLPHVLDAVTVLAGEEQNHFPSAVIGAGTGLGHCLVLPGKMPVVVGSEAGHTLFPFTSDEENLRRFLADIHGTDRLETEMAMAGDALANIYAYCTGQKVHPHEVSPLAAKNPEVMDLISRFYGRAVQHYILNTLPLGGIYITGGLAANLPEVLTHPAFARELREMNPMGKSLGAIPVRHVRNTSLGLWGAAAYACLLLGGLGIFHFR